MKFTKKDILSALKTITVPGEGKNMIESEAVKNVVIFNDEVIIDISISNPTLQARKRTEVNIMKAIHDLVYAKAKIKINVTVDAPPQPKNEIKGKVMKKAEIVICPPSIYLESFVNNLQTKTVSIGAQNILWENKGSYTGEISAPMVKNLKANYVIIGHSERRKYFGETDEKVNLRVKSALKNGLTPVVCIGETKDEKNMDQTMDVIIRQIREGLGDMSRTQLEKIVFAYEPVWAVGSDKIPSSNEIMGAKLLIKKILTERYGPKYVEKVRILYGGSVKPNLVKQVCIEPEMDGVLVGRDSLAPHSLIKIAQEINNNKSS